MEGLLGLGQPIDKWNLWHEEFAEMDGTSARDLRHSAMSLSETASSALESFRTLAGGMDTTVPSAVALANTTAMEQSTAQRTWFGTFGQMTLFLIKVIPGVLYWLITFTTITLPTFLFTLFSTSLTFTMNATTL